MPNILVVPHPPTLSFYRSALRIIGRRSSEDPHIPPQLSHLRSKLKYNIRDGIMIYQHIRDLEKIQTLIAGGERDLAMIQAWAHVDPHWLERIFKRPTAKKS